MQVSNNKVSGGPSAVVGGNTIGKNLNCNGNNPAPTGGGNTVSGNNNGQCAGFYELTGKAARSGRSRAAPAPGRTLGVVPQPWSTVEVVNSTTIRYRDVTPLTGSLALVAGGASGLVAIARELGGDDRVVSVVQYLRVALVTASMPVVVTLVYHADKMRTAPKPRKPMPLLGI